MNKMSAKFLILWSDEINHSNFENATKCLNKSWWYLLKHACFILELEDFCNTCVHFQWKKTNWSRHNGILSALRMRGLHDKRQLLAKLRIAGSENQLLAAKGGSWLSGFANELKTWATISPWLANWAGLLVWGQNWRCIVKQKVLGLALGLRVWSYYIKLETDV